MNLGEFRILVRGMQGMNSIAAPDEISMFAEMALQELAGVAADIGGPRMLYPYLVDLIQNESEYKLPQNIRAVKGVERLDVRCGPFPLTPMSFTQRAHDIEDGMMVAEPQSFWGYWITHSTLHITPAPQSNEPAKLRVWAYMVPDIPRDESEEMPVHVAMMPWLIAKTAELAHPPLDTLPLIERQLAKRETALRRWFLDAVKDVPPSVAAEGWLE